MTWKEVNRLKVLGYEVENVLAVIDLILSLPPTSVRNECSFSIMKLAKGKRRARMNPDTLNNLLTISLMGQSIQEFNPKECIDHFLVRGLLIVLSTVGLLLRLNERLNR